jgi:hypothetical protein
MSMSPQLRKEGKVDMAQKPKKLIYKPSQSNYKEDCS